MVIVSLMLVCLGIPAVTLLIIGHRKDSLAAKLRADAQQAKECLALHSEDDLEDDLACRIEQAYSDYVKRSQASEQTPKRAVQDAPSYVSPYLLRFPIVGDSQQTKEGLALHSEDDLTCRIEQAHSDRFKVEIEEYTGLTIRQIWNMSLPEIREHMQKRRGEAPAESEVNQELDRVLNSILEIKPVASKVRDYIIR